MGSESYISSHSNAKLGIGAAEDVSHTDHVEHTKRGGNVGECCNRINCFKSMANEVSFY